MSNPRYPDTRSIKRPERSCWSLMQHHVLVYRDCVHSAKYRLTKSTNLLPVLAQALILCVSASGRHRSPWPA
jgi:hypothetical protein